nr:bromodomain-containing protein 9-like [Ipomoea batatas]
MRVRMVKPQPKIPPGQLLAREDKAIGSNSYNLKKGTAHFMRYRSNDVSLYRLTGQWRRVTLAGFPTIGNDVSQVGLSWSQHALCKTLPSVMQANLGPCCLEGSVKEIAHVLFLGRVQFGPGWVGEGGARPQPSCLSPETQNSPNRLATSDHHSSRPLTPPFPSSNSATASTSSEAMVEAVRKLNSLNEMSDQRSGGYTPQAALQKSIFHPNRNGMNGMFGYDLNVRVQPPGPASPSSSIQIGSPKQPDLALQL